MSHIPVDKINYADANYDAYQRLRTSHAETIFDSVSYYGNEEEFRDPVLVGIATATHLPNESAWALTCSANNGDKVVNETVQSMRYNPGKSQLMMMTGVMTPKANVVQRVGLHNDDNGLFFEANGTTPGVVVRSKTTGSVVDTRIDQTNWNLDKLDGTGGVGNPSGITIDFSKAQIFIIDCQWLGAGRVRYGFSIAGKTIYCHEVDNANVGSTVYTSTIDLPLRYEIENIGPAASPTTFKRICSTVISEAGSIKRGRPRTWNTGITAVTIPPTTPTHVVTMRMQNPHNGRVNKSEAILTDVQTIAATNDRPVLVTFIRNATVTGGTYDPHPNSLIEINSTATGYSGGTDLYSLVLSGKSIAQVTYNEDVQLRDDETITITAVALGLAVDVWGAVNWRERV